MKDIKIIFMKDFKLALVILCFNSNRLSNFLEKLSKFKFGCEVDLIFVHNKIEINSTKNRFIRTTAEINEVTDLIYSFKYEGIKTIVERENVGEDMGAYHHIFTLFQNQYTHFFFLNEAASINCDNWLALLHSGYNFDNSVVAISPQVCPSTTHSYCLTSTFWGITSEFGKTMEWPAPKSRKDCEIQEMGLVWPQAKAQGYHIAQIGDGENILSYKNKHYVQEGVY
jgi:hypothetical protein